MTLYLAADAQQRAAAIRPAAAAAEDEEEREEEKEVSAFAPPSDSSSTGTGGPPAPRRQLHRQRVGLHVGQRTGRLCRLPIHRYQCRRRRVREMVINVLWTQSRELQV